MTRYREIGSAEMTPAQKEVHDEIVAGGRGRFGGPFQILIRAPEACRHLQRLGEYLRWSSSLSQGLVELGTIVGYYTAIGNALNAFQVPLPAGAPQPFPE
jgi:4-carboxymuconolactone decarboxylase